MAAVKICGLTRAADVGAAIAAGARYCGFIVEAKSPRRLSVDDATALAAHAQAQNPKINTVAVTVNPDDALVTAIRRAGFSHIQLHGAESLQRTAEIASSGLSVIKVGKVSSQEDVKMASEFSGAADLILFDAKPPKGDAQQGGHGLAFDWSILRGAPTPKRWILAGGLIPENVAAAITATRAPIVDVSSGVEASPGIKDAALIEAFMKAARG